jgi:hypothetical protein
MNKKEANERRQKAYAIRNQAALNEKNRNLLVHQSNGDEEKYPNRIGNYSKCLPHNELGEVDPEAYNAFVFAAHSDNFDDFEAIPLAGSMKLKSAMGGLSFCIQGPDSYAVPSTPPPAFDSAELAAEMVELYWMALLRDVSFDDYATNPLVAEAAADLSKMPGFRGVRDKKTKKVTPATLFRTDYAGALEGPVTSQFQLLDYSVDGVPVRQRLEVPVKGLDYCTDYDEWLAAQRGFPEGTSPAIEKLDKTTRFIRNMRDMGWTADTSLLFSTYFKTAMLLFPFGSEALDDGNPYKHSFTQVPFSKFGLGHLIMLLGHVGPVPQAGVHKWQIHRFLRPEAFAGRIHNHLSKKATYPIHESLFKSSVLDKIFKYNEQVNKKRKLGAGTYLLPVEFGTGSPTHPSFPAGHGMAAGVGVTLLKAWFNESMVIPEKDFDGSHIPKKPNKDGTALEDYHYGVDGPALTIGGELNKLAHNITWGRNMSGVHYWHDGFEANRMGEEIALRILAEEGNTYAEPSDGFSVTKFNGEKVTV